MSAQCLVCCFGFEGNDDCGPPVSTGCGHVYHRLCITQWLEHKPLCPVCKRKSCERDLRRLYFNTTEGPAPAPDHDPVQVARNAMPDNVADLDDDAIKQQLDRAVMDVTAELRQTTTMAIERAERAEQKIRAQQNEINVLQAMQQSLRQDLETSEWHIEAMEATKMKAEKDRDRMKHEYDTLAKVCERLRRFEQLESWEISVAVSSTSRVWDANRIQCLLDTWRLYLQSQPVLLLDSSVTPLPVPHATKTLDLRQRLQHALAEHASRPALSYGDVTLSYTQLSACVASLAKRIHAALKPGTDQRIGCCLEKSFQLSLVVATIWSIGHSYVALPAAHPRERLEHIARISEVKLVITDTAHDWWSNVCETVLFVDESIVEHAAAVDNTATTQSPAQTVCSEEAYIITTSGSTGLPKAISISGESLCAYLDGLSSSGLCYRTDDVVLQACASAFDPHIQEIAGTFLSGGHLVCSDSMTLIDSSAISALMLKHSVSCTISVPSLLAAHFASNCSYGITLRMLIVGGEIFPARLLHTCRERLPQTLVANLYGPAEATICCVALVDAGRMAHKLGSADVVPIGFPLVSHRVALMDTAGQPVPRGVVGELWIAGALMNGYVGSSDLTARVIEQDAGGRRWYRSGDLCFEQEDAPHALVYVERHDNQVKLRGQRIEPGEVEAVLHDACTVRQAVVVKDSQREQLVAFVVAAATTGQPAVGHIERAALERCRATLPSFMIPSRVIVIDRMPVTSFGKADRRALLELLDIPIATTPSDNEDVVSWLPLERTIYSVLRTLLGEGVQITRDADFFVELGGHSLLTVQYLSRLRQTGMPVSLPLSALFRYTTIRTLAAHICDMQASRCDFHIVIEPLNDYNEVAASPSASVQAASNDGAHHTGFLIIRALTALIWLLVRACIAGGAAALGGLSSSGIPNVFLQALIFILVTFSVSLVGTAVVALPLVRALDLPPGTYPRFGLAHLRLWLANRLFKSTEFLWRLSCDTKILPVLLRLLGSDVAGSAVVSTTDLQAFKAIHIGHGSDLQPRVAIRPVRWHASTFEVVPVIIGEHCVVGAGCVLEAGAVLGDRVMADDMTLLNAVVPADSHARGCPVIVSTQSQMSQLRARSQLHVMTVFAGLLIPILAVSIVIAVAIALVSVHWTLAAFGVPVMLLIIGPLAAVIAAFLLGRLPFSIRVVFWRQWSLFLDIWSFTVWHNLILRAAGWTVSSDVEVAGPVADYWLSPIPPRLEASATVSSCVQLGGMYDSKEVIIPAGSFCGNNSCITAVATLGTGAVVASCSAYTHEVDVRKTAMYQQHSPVWFGNPCQQPSLRASAMPSSNAVESNGNVRRIILEGLGFFGLVLCVWLCFVALWVTGYSIAQGSSSFVVVLVVAVLFPPAFSLVVIAIKWLLLQRFTETSHDIHSTWFTLRTLYYKLMGAWSVLVGSVIAGSPLAILFWRLMGARIAWSAEVEADIIMEPDLVEVGERAVLSCGSLLQPHTFEDRQFTMRRVRLEQDAVIGCGTVVLAGACVGAGVCVHPLSLVLKGDTLSGTMACEWHGALLEPKRTA
eukprot:TRINITY_DN2362_c1_g1_i3.p1 TRINITY_DN2362_c1_g1~~TRINITY_DN2362_c1_g1_i3.p1  ORF type:complete len:1555 (-),score=221.09 TRINITY_DN2362_c1_g1_i3:355-5019(-)